MGNFEPCSIPSDPKMLKNIQKTQIGLREDQYCDYFSRVEQIRGDENKGVILHFSQLHGINVQGDRDIYNCAQPNAEKLIIISQRRLLERLQSEDPNAIFLEGYDEIPPEFQQMFAVIGVVFSPEDWNIATPDFRTNILGKFGVKSVAELQDKLLYSLG